MFKLLKRQNHDLNIKYKITSRNHKKQLKSHHEETEKNLIYNGGNAIHKYIKHKLAQDNNIPYLIDETKKFYFNDEEKCSILGKEFQKKLSKQKC